MYNEKRIKNSERLQLLLLDNLYAQSGSEGVIFQDGTSLRWVYGGVRFSEDLDFVTNLPGEKLEKLLRKAFKSTKKACIAQFGPGLAEVKRKGRRKEATRLFYIYRPENQRERIAVKMEFELLRDDRRPRIRKVVLRDLPMVAGLITAGSLAMPYSSSIIIVETPEELFSDKIRALFERSYLKGRDIYDIWRLTEHLKVTPDWSMVKEKLFMYEAPFSPARDADWFQQDQATRGLIEAMKTDLPRFLPQTIFSSYEEMDFSIFIENLKAVCSELLGQGMKEFFEEHGEKRNT